MTARINFFKECLDQHWAVLRADTELSARIGANYLERQMPDPAIMEAAPYLCGWPAQTEDGWWAGQATRSVMTIEHVGVVITGNTWDYDALTALTVDALTCIIQDFRAPGGLLRGAGYVVGLKPGGVSWDWWPKFRGDAGASLARWRIQYELRNPNL